MLLHYYMSGQLRCYECERTEVIPGELEFQARARAGELQQVCKVCFLASELSVLVSQIECADSPTLIAGGLQALYGLAHRRLGDEIEGDQASPSQP